MRKLLLLCVLGLFTAGARADDWPGARVSTEWLAKHLDGSVTIVCTSPRDQFAQGHIPGAVNIPDWQLFAETRNNTQSFVLTNKSRAADILRMKGISPGMPIVVYDDFANPWPQDGRLYWTFRYYGFARVGLLDGGMAKWKKENGQTDTGGTVTKMSQVSVGELTFREELAASRDWIRQNMGFGKMDIIDVREENEFMGARLYGEKRGGHIPGAVNIPWRTFFRDDGTIKSATDIKLLLTQKGVTGKKPIVVYCAAGVRSGIAFYALETIGFPVREYDGSWWEWAADPDLPAETKR